MGYRAIIREIRKKNFRSIVEATIPLDNFNIFVGLNDCGKSNVLKALNLFFNGETEAGHSLDFKRDYCQHGRTGKGKAKEIVIEVSIQVPEEFSEAGIKKWKKVWRDNKLHEDNFTTLFVIYTEGKTDIKYLKLAFSKFPEYADIQSRVDYYDIEHANKTGDGELQTICEYLQKGNDPNIKICMFDRDNPQMIRNEEYSAYANNTYRFNIPIPSHRSEDDRIAIEHYLSDEDLSTIDSDGKKLFLAKEFDDVGRSLDGQFFRQHAKRHDHEKYDPLEILNGSEDKRVYSIHQNDSKNYALTKDQFVAHIENQDNGFDFDFSAYRLILGIIEKIVAEADRKNLGQ